jgi:hypothetical protein
MCCIMSISTQDVGIKYSVSSVSWDNDIGFVGTSGNKIWKLSLDDGPNLNWVGKALVSTHTSLPTGLSVSSDGLFAATGDNGILRL